MFKTLDDIEVSGRRVLVRGDLNVPVKDGRVTAATRIERLAPTIRDLLDKGAAVIVMSHFGRPKGKVMPEMSLRPVGGSLSQVRGGRTIQFVAARVGPGAV